MFYWVWCRRTALHLQQVGLWLMPLQVWAVVVPWQLQMIAAAFVLAGDGWALPAQFVSRWKSASFLTSVATATSRLRPLFLIATSGPQMIAHAVRRSCFLQGNQCLRIRDEPQNVLVLDGFSPLKSQHLDLLTQSRCSGEQVKDEDEDDDGDDDDDQ